MSEIIIYPKNSTVTVKSARNQYMTIADENGRVVRNKFGERIPTPQKANPVPWVKVGNLYLSLFETGNNSWPPIVIDLTGQDFNSTAKYTVMSGRHGAPIQSQLSNFQFTGIKEEGMIGEDMSRVSYVNEKYNKVSVEVLDVTQVEYNSPLMLKNVIKQHLNGGKVVILAWCFSIFALKTAKGDMFTPGTPANLQYYSNMEKQIAAIITEDWGFVQ